ncbi:MAG: hypothetical protein AAGI01_11675 [Myxococcota bacterium]
MHRTTRRSMVMVGAALWTTLWGGHALANGAAWEDAPSVGLPGPVKETRLRLLEEAVTFERGVVRATFRVGNPTKEDVTLDVGFPVRIPQTLGGFPPKDPRELLEHGDLSDPAALATFAAEKLSPKVAVDGEAARAKILTNPKNVDYPVTYVWPMTVKAKSEAVFTVAYPLVYSWYESDFGEVRMTHTYITHTGSFWATPIGRATFEFCDDRLMKSVLGLEPGTHWVGDEATTAWEVTHHIKPKPTRVDTKRGCIIWERRRWRPKKNKDDLLVEVSIRPSLADLFFAEEESREDVIVSRWCQAEPSLADVLSLKDVVLEAKDLPALSKPAMAMIRRTDPSSEEALKAAEKELVAAPEHVRLNFELAMYRYMRNYYFALRGYAFEDPMLARCFQGLTPNAKVGASEGARQTIRALLFKEKRGKLARNRAVRALKHTHPDPEHYERLVPTPY